MSGKPLPMLFVAESAIIDQLYSQMLGKATAAKNLPEKLSIFQHGRLQPASDLQPDACTSSCMSLSSHKPFEVLHPEQSRNGTSLKEQRPIQNTLTCGGREDTQASDSWTCNDCSVQCLVSPPSLSHYHRVCFKWNHVVPQLDTLALSSENSGLSAEVIPLARHGSTSDSAVCGDSKHYGCGLAAASQKLINIASLKNFSSSLHGSLSAVDKLNSEMFGGQNTTCRAVLRKPNWLKSQLTFPLDKSIMCSKSQDSVVGPELCQETTERLPSLACSDTDRKSANDTGVTSANKRHRDRPRKRSVALRGSGTAVETSVGQSFFRYELGKWSPLKDINKSDVGKKSPSGSLRTKVPLEDMHQSRSTFELKKSIDTHAPDPAAVEEACCRNSVFEKNASSCAVHAKEHREATSINSEQQSPTLPSVAASFRGSNRGDDEDDEVQSVSSDCSGIVPYAKRQKLIDSHASSNSKRISPPLKQCKSRALPLRTSSRHNHRARTGSACRNRRSPRRSSSVGSPANTQKSSHASGRPVASRVGGTADRKKRVKGRGPLKDRNCASDFRMAETALATQRKQATRKALSHKPLIKMTNRRTFTSSALKPSVLKGRGKRENDVVVGGTADTQSRGRKRLTKGISRRTIGNGQMEALNCQNRVQTRLAKSALVNQMGKGQKRKYLASGSQQQQQKKHRLYSVGRKKAGQNDLLSKQSAIISQHETLSAEATSGSIWSLIEKDMFFQLCQLEERAKEYDDSVMQALIPIKEMSPVTNIYRKQADGRYSSGAGGHVGGIWKSIFS